MGRQVQVASQERVKSRLVPNLSYVLLIEGYRLGPKKM